MALADLLDGLTTAQWESPSLCSEWRIRDVAAHLTTVSVPVPAGSGPWAGRSGPDAACPDFA